MCGSDCRLALYGDQLFSLSPLFCLPWIINGMLIAIATANSGTTATTTLLESLIRHPTTQTVTSHNHDQRHQRRVVCPTRQSASPIQTDRQGQSALCDRVRLAESAFVCGDIHMSTRSWAKSVCLSLPITEPSHEQN